MEYFREKKYQKRPEQIRADQKENDKFIAYVNGRYSNDAYIFLEDQVKRTRQQHQMSVRDGSDMKHISFLRKIFEDYQHELKRIKGDKYQKDLLKKSLENST